MDTYICMHIPSGKTVVNKFEDTFVDSEKGRHLSESAKYRLVNEWNRMGRELWKYWIE